MSSFYENFFNFWETYNGFALLSIILGILCFFFPWFQKENPWFINLPPEDLYLLEFFSFDLHIALFGLLFLFGFSFLIFYYLGIILRNRGTYGTPFEAHAQKFFILSIIILITFEVSAFIHFLAPLDLSDIWFHWFHNWVYVEYWRIDTGFFIGLYMISSVITSFIYEKFTLRRHYKKYLPEFEPNNGKTQAKEISEDLHSMYYRIGFFVFIFALIALTYLMVVFIT